MGMQWAGAKKGFSALLWAVAGLALSGCSYWSRPVPELLGQLPDVPTVRLVHYPSPPMKMKRAAHVGVGWVAGGPGGIVLGHRIHQVTGKAMLAEYEIPYPVEQVQDRLAEAFRKGLGMHNLTVHPEPVGSLAELPEAVPGEWVFRLHAEKVKFSFFIADWDHYRLKYNADLRLVRRDDGRVLWKGECHYNSNRSERPPEWGEGNPTLDEIEAARGDMLREILSEAADSCADQLLVQFMGRVPEGKDPVRTVARDAGG